MGLALLSFHGALEDHFRNVLESTIALPSAQRARVKDARQVQWKELIDLMQQYHHLNDHHKNWILSINRLRQGAGHGGRFSGTRTEVDKYGTFVRMQINGSASNRPIVNQRQSVSRYTAKRSTNSVSSVIPHQFSVRSSKFGILSQWIIVNLFGFIISIIATAILSNIAIWLGILPEKWIERGFSLSLIIAVIFLGLGLAQESIITKLFGKLSRKWAISTAIGALIASSFLQFISIAAQQHKYHPGPIANIFFIVTMGLSIGFFQSLILRTLTKKANLWLMSSSIQGVSHIVICMILPVLWGEGFGWVLSIFIGWGLSIVASGATLVYLVKDTRSKSS